MNDDEHDNGKDGWADIENRKAHTSCILSCIV